MIEPVLMAPLRREWDAVKGEVDSLLDKMHPTNASARTRTLRQMEDRLSGFAAKLRGVRILDPACGSGNFLYVALKELLDLEKEVSAYAGKVGLTPFFPGVGPDQLFGIETNLYAHELAQVTVWIGYLQWTIANGFGTREDPVLGPMTNILLMDALVERGEDGALREPKWPEADVVVGNPPFLGNKRMRTELGDEYVEGLRELYAGRVPGGADLVTYWFERSRALIQAGAARRVGLLATQAIRGGANRVVLQRIKETGGIFFAESDRPWVLDGAAVRVSMVGFDDGTQKDKLLDGTLVADINANLTGAVDLTRARRLPENARVAFQGPVVVGPFDVDPDTARRLLREPNPHGRPNSDVIFPTVNAADITGRSRGWYIIDFGQLSEEEASLYEAPFEYVREHVKPLRDNNRDGQRRRFWWRHGRSGAALRRSLAGKSRQIATPRVAKHRVFVRLPAETVVTDAVVAFALEDDYSFGILHSRVHELWARGTGTQLREVESGFRYTPTTCFETFPFPKSDEERRAGISAAAERLDGLRRNWLNPEGLTDADLKKRTLTNLYNDRPTWLQNAHATLDRAVFAAYGWPEDPEELAEEELLGRLLDLNARRAEVSARSA
ncbi:MAG: hypothetical protein M3R38_23725 [Actinomycetota bacterium]|nr:hypothetical protein [Actinomycetota bacterium]